MFAHSCSPGCGSLGHPLSNRCVSRSSCGTFQDVRTSIHIKAVAITTPTASKPQDDHGRVPLGDDGLMCGGAASGSRGDDGVTSIPGPRVAVAFAARERRDTAPRCAPCWNHPRARPCTGSTHGSGVPRGTYAARLLETHLTPSVPQKHIPPRRASKQKNPRICGGSSVFGCLGRSESS